MLIFSATDLDWLVQWPKWNDLTWRRIIRSRDQASAIQRIIFGVAPDVIGDKVVEALKNQNPVLDNAKIFFKRTYEEKRGEMR